MAPKTRFRDLIRTQREASPELPLVHSTDAYRFVDIMDSDSLTPQSCRIFGQPLLYCFYGRPAYRANLDEAPSGLGHYLPVCVLFKAPKGCTPRRVFPFDSGAFKSGYYEEAIHRAMSVDDFGLDADPHTPGRVISLFFGSVGAYLNTQPSNALEVDFTQFEARAYHALITKQTKSNADDRVCAIEVQLDESVSLQSAAQAIIGPGPLLECAPVKNYISRLGIDALPYDQLGRARPGEYATELVRLCREYYKRSGLMS